mmetsp:Transcript_10839/g.13432  ORF Transcript_10839/g.13432 Transcript_10839/m.13432 type:complete len:359 (-) Transcript_10839:290-1366(-)|eukprot:CAMPEP_0172486078 /NCGR_PEP_ID=MMETSP1066-20121228/14461_1 /TAXON_ID=671091 /ORGANISM="Coscinodiscus wailesii, Strain CCMP2513" /LENGTH=358 /DNA_ID=CAMNT_0013251791 /DNA_START=204 /DNA_END=1280 /DNA_ORIENTATION=+
MYTKYSLIGVLVAGAIWALSSHSVVITDNNDRDDRTLKHAGNERRRLGFSCKEWCDEIELPWIDAAGGDQKCDWEHTCAGCNACSRFFEDGDGSGANENNESCGWNPWCYTKKAAKYVTKKFKSVVGMNPDGNDVNGTDANGTDTNATITEVALAFSDEAGGNTRGPCKEWCSDNELPWIAPPGEYQKCNWLNTCAGCSACSQRGAVSGFYFEEREEGVGTWVAKKWNNTKEAVVNVVKGAKNLFTGGGDKPDNEVNTTNTNETMKNETIIDVVEGETDKAIKEAKETIEDADVAAEKNIEDEMKDVITESVVEEASDCKDWCSKAKAPWQPTDDEPNHKCGWAGHCSGCAECYEDAQ